MSTSSFISRQVPQSIMGILQTYLLVRKTFKFHISKVYFIRQLETLESLYMVNIHFGYVKMKCFDLKKNCPEACLIIILVGMFAIIYMTRNSHRSLITESK